MRGREFVGKEARVEVQGYDVRIDIWILHVSHSPLESVVYPNGRRYCMFVLIFRRESRWHRWLASFAIPTRVAAICKDALAEQIDAPE